MPADTAHHEPRRPRPAPRGFSLVEAVVASLIVGVLMVAALQTVGSAVTARRSHALMRQGDLLARQLIDEIVQCRYAEPDESAAKTPDANEIAEEPAASRTAWNDVDDYHGLVESPPTFRDGAPVPGAAGWRRSVTVERIKPGNLSVVGGLTETGLKRITVTARSPGGIETTMVALRGSGGTHDAPMSSGDSQVTWAGVTIAVGEDGGAVSSGTALLNRPAP